MVKIVAFASGSVNVFSDVVGPLNFVNPFPVPPLLEARVPVHPAVKVTADRRAAVALGLVTASVTFVSLDVVNAAPEPISEAAN